MKIAIMIPAIIDQECAQAVTSAMRENIVLANPDCEFTFLINIDDYCRTGCFGNVTSVSNAYNELAKEVNCLVNIVVHKHPLGLTLASRKLFERFLDLDSDYLIFFDDDCVVINPIHFSEFLGVVKDDVTLHLAFAYDNASVENPFIKNDIQFEGDTVRVFSNSAVFMTENGTIFTRDNIRDILDEYGSNEKKFDRSRNPEDVIGGLDCYRKRPVWTVTYKADDCIVADKSPKKNRPLWRLPRKNHFIVDSIRHHRKVGWNK